MLSDDEKKWIQEVYPDDDTDNVWRKLWDAHREQTETLEQERLMAKGLISGFVEERNKGEEQLRDTKVLLVLADAEVEERRAQVGQLKAELTTANARADAAEGARALLQGGYTICNSEREVLTAELAAANARIAELEALKALANAQADLFAERMHAANARADAAERAHAFADQTYDDWKAHAESESAALRAEVEHLRGEHLHPCGAKESELIELRAEVERLESLFQQTHGCHHSWVQRANALVARDTGELTDNERQHVAECSGKAGERALNELDMARQGREYWLQMEQRQAEKTKRAESEAAALRAEVERLNERYNRVWRALDNPPARYAPMIGAPNNYMGMTQADEGAWCRCEDVKLIVALASAAQSGLADARALLEEVRDGNRGGALLRIDAWLAANLESPRAAAERAVKGDDNAR